MRQVDGGPDQLTERTSAKPVQHELQAGEDSGHTGQSQPVLLSHCVSVDSLGQLAIRAGPERVRTHRCWSSGIAIDCGQTRATVVCNHRAQAKTADAGARRRRHRRGQRCSDDGIDCVTAIRQDPHSYFRTVGLANNSAKFGSRRFATQQQTRNAARTECGRSGQFAEVAAGKARIVDDGPGLIAPNGSCAR